MKKFIALNSSRAIHIDQIAEIRIEINTENSYEKRLEFKTIQGETLNGRWKSNEAIGKQFRELCND